MLVFRHAFEEANTSWTTTSTQSMSSLLQCLSYLVFWCWSWYSCHSRQKMTGRLIQMITTWYLNLTGGNRRFNCREVRGNGQSFEVVLYSTLLCCKLIVHVCKRNTRQLHISSITLVERILDKQLRPLNRTGQIRRYQRHILLVMELALSWNGAWSMKILGISNPGLSNRKLLDPQDRYSLGHSVMILFSHTAKIYCRD